jgi:4-hydroxy-3-methylbut-2-enyl diphosphate reductase
MCFGVRDAISLAWERAGQGPLTVFGELVHNNTVLDSLQARGIRIEHDAANISTSTVMITAHGASDKALARLSGRNLNVVEATCPLVHFAHRAVRQFVQAGYHPVIIGKRDHVEVRGLTEDLAECDVIASEEEVELLRERSRFGVAAQTTQPIHRVRYLVNLNRKRFPQSEVRFTDTVCQPTKQRQASAVELARECQAVVVVGGWHSNNTRELVQTCRRFCPSVFHVESAQDLQPEWFDRLEIVGLTAGTSTPDYVIDAVEQRLQDLALVREQAAVPQRAKSEAEAKAAA